MSRIKEINVNSFALYSQINLIYFKAAIKMQTDKNKQLISGAAAADSLP